jgi:16S rRNA (cytosine1402-N4)-methyltransferase
MLASSCSESSVPPKVAHHEPVLLRETLELLSPVPGGTYVDLTLGLGGHAEGILEASAPEGRVVGIDRDREALAHASTRLARFGERFVPLHGDHREIGALLHGAGVFAVDGILADLGLSSLQLDDPERGFSFQADGPLDMRMDPSSGPTAADLLATLPERELRRILKVYGEEMLAGRIARAIVLRRAKAPVRRTSELRQIVERVAGPRARRFRIHPATRTFQALRIAVNGEIDGLETLVPEAVSFLRRGGRLVVLSFHSLEDRAVKRAMRALAERCICPPGLPVCGCGREDLVRLVSTRALRPSSEEIDRNPRSRSARLRAAERL